MSVQNEKYGKDGNKKDKPLVTFLLIAYNQEKFIKEAINGAVSQTYAPMEIILSDDCSTDRTFSIMENVARDYQGDHRIILNRSKTNLGLVPHLNELMTLCSGEFIAFAAGDDVSLPNRITDSVSVMTSDPSLSAFSLALISGEHYPPLPKESLTTGLKPIVKSDVKDFCKDTSIHINAPARMIRKDVFSLFGSLNANCMVEDQPILFRALLIGQIGLSKKHGVFYRIHGSNMSGGAGKKSFDFKQIYNNCRSDLDLAISKKLVSAGDESRIRNAIGRRQRRDKLWRGHKNSDHKWFFLLFKIFPSSAIGIKGKVSRLLKLIKS